MHTIVENQQSSTSALPAQQQLPIVFGKKELAKFFGYTRTSVLTKIFFDQHRLNRLGITNEQYKKIRLFNFEQCTTIRKELSECGI